MFSIILLIASIIILFVTLANVLLWPKVGRSNNSSAKKVSVLIPARNEESNLASCLETVLGQGDGVAEILIYDDHSHDGTGGIIRKYTEQDVRVRAIAPLSLPTGWCGKNFACAQLASAATSPLLLFIDADVRLTDSAVSRMVNEMDRRRLEFLSCWPGLEMEGFWERILMPSLNFVVFSIFPAPLSLIRSYPSLALAHGACLMFDRESYHSLGGHSAVRDQIFEDTRLAQLWRSHGRRALCLDGQDVVRVRMYHSFSEIWQGFHKNFYPAFRHEINFWFFLTFHFTVFLLPFVLLIFTPSVELWLAASAIISIRLVMASYFRHPIRAALLHPLSEIILLALGLFSWWRCKSGRGVAWKGRQYSWK